MFKKVLLGGSALAGIAALALPASAGQVGSKDMMSVTLGGELRFNVAFIDQDVSAAAGRGYTFSVDESEIKIGAKATADNGLNYGVNIELNAGAGDTANADEAYAFIDSDSWGRVEMGDQDDTTDRMHVAAHNILVGRAGADGDSADYIAFGGTAIDAPGVDSTSDDTKVSYFSPRFGGIQIGGSLTPDSGEVSGGPATSDADNDGDFENVFGLAINYKGKFDDVGIEAGLIGEFGDSETATGADTEGEIETIGVGINVTFAGIGLGAEYVDFAEKGIAAAARTAGRDAGNYYQLGASYQTGPWGVSLGWFESSVSNATGSGGDTDVTIISLDGAYNVAPGWELMASLHLGEVDNMNSTAAEVNNDGTAFIVSNQFKF